MLNSCSSNAILTKVRAIFGQRLTEADYAQMARKKDVGEVAAYLKERSTYAKALRNIRETEVHRGQLEALLRKDTFYKYAALRRYDFSGSGFYDFILIRLEVREILRRLSYIQAGQHDAYVADLPSYLIQRTSFSLKALAEADSFDDLLLCLQGTPYRQLLTGLTLDGSKSAYLRCEFALYHYYYQFLFDSIDHHFHGKTRSEMRQILLCEIDTRNIETVFRLKRFYQMEDEEIRSLLQPWSGALKKEQIDRMLAAGTTAEMAAAAPFLPTRSDLPEGFIELMTHSYRYRFDQKKLRFATNAPVAMYTFLTLRDIEVENDITVIEGVRYQIPQEEILHLLIQ